MNAINGPDECMQRCVPEAIQEVIDLTGFLCFLFRSTENREKDDGSVSSCQSDPPGLRGANNNASTRDTERGRDCLAVNH